MTSKRYCTLMMESELIAALKDAKEQIGLPEGAQIRLALRTWLRKQRITINKSARKRAAIPKRP